MLNWLITDTQKYMQIVLHFKSDKLRCVLTTFASTSRVIIVKNNHHHNHHNNSNMNNNKRALTS